jgi:hypothetical protein
LYFIFVCTLLLSFYFHLQFPRALFLGEANMCGRLCYAVSYLRPVLCVELYEMSFSDSEVLQLSADFQSHRGVWLDVFVDEEQL